MRIVVHPPTVIAPDGAGDVVAVVLAAVREQHERLETESTGVPVPGADREDRPTISLLGGLPK